MDISRFFTKLREHKFRCLKDRLKWQKRELELKADVRTQSHSLIWVWEFSKKAVLICFMFYMIVQVYSMWVMVKYYDFTHLGVLIEQTGQIVQNCVFGYLVKAGVENVFKISRSHDDGSSEDEPVG